MWLCKKCGSKAKKSGWGWFVCSNPKCDCQYAHWVEKQ
jgi:hypothetical protein